MLSPDIKGQFGTAVRTRRKRLGFSQEELAGRAGLHRTYVADIERGARNLSLANIEKLACALETSIPTLFTLETSGKSSAEREIGEILLVEDEPVDVQLTLRAFKSACLTNRVHVVRDGPEALDFLFATGSFARRATEPLPQLVLLDLKLPRMSGLEVLRRIKADERTRRVPVVVLSSSDSDRDIEESKRLGAETYIMKPVDFHGLTQVAPQLQLCWALLKQNPITSA